MEESEPKEMAENKTNQMKEILKNLKEEDKISQGAEAIMYKIKFDNKYLLVKHRFTKLYREPTLDKTINKKRVNNEYKMLKKFEEINVLCPKVYYCIGLDIVMEYIEGKTLKNYVNDNYEEGNYSPKTYEVMRKLGVLIGSIHKKGFIHGDLTTSNFMITADNDIVIIDFGLSTTSQTTEDRAVDLYVLERALLCTHHKAEDLFNSILEGYKETGDKPLETLKHLDEVRMRGRKKDMSG